MGFIYTNHLLLYPFLKTQNLFSYGNLTESFWDVKWKTHSTLLPLRWGRARVGVNGKKCELRIESTGVRRKESLCFEI
jgi:hypothetical protein